jgi:histidyl-tRNA synthetase
MSVGKATKLMHKLKAVQVIFIGEDERRTGTWKVKDMLSGEQTVEEETSLERLIQKWEGDIGNSRFAR